MSRKQRRQDIDSRMPFILKVGLVLTIVGTLGYASLFWRNAPAPPTGARARASDGGAVVLGGRLRFDDATRQAHEFIGYYNSIHLSPEQEALKSAVLQKRPAACCKNSNAYTCCCTCNLSKTVWGLSNYAIAELHVNARELNEVIDGWHVFVNPSGYERDTCYTGGCSLPGKQNGCGGMTEQELSL